MTKILKIGDKLDPMPIVIKAKAVSPVERRRWHLAEVTNDKVAEESAKGLGYLTYVPRFVVTARDKARHRAMTEQSRALFGGYLFIGFNRELDPWGEIARARGFVGIVQMAGSPCAVPAPLIDGLRAREPENFGLPRRILRGDRVTFGAGEEVRVSDGVFTGVNATFFADLPNLDGRQRITALIEILGRFSKVDLYADQVERI